MVLPVTIPSDIEKMVGIPAVQSINQLVNSIVGGPRPPQFEPLAEEIASEEREDIGLFWKALDYLIRPQRAVAGVIYDAMDGGDFSPLDRTTEALLGNERYRMKDVIDLISPGTWQNMRMPEFLGGKDIDIGKESLGFVADVLTDPIMALAPFTVLGRAGAQTFKFAGPTEKAARKWAARSPELAEQVVEGGVKYKNAVGAAAHMPAAYARYRGEVAQLNYIYRKAMENPAAFAKEFGIDERLVRAGLGPSIRGQGTDLLLPSLSSQVQAGQRGGPLAVKTPWLMQKLGIPEKSFSLIPMIDRQAGFVMAKGIEDLWGRAMANPAIYEPVRFLQKLFKFGTGHKLADYYYMQTLGRTEHYGKDLAGKMDEMQDILKGNLDEEFTSKVLDYVVHPKSHFGQIARQVPPEYAPAVKAMNDFTMKLRLQEATSPLLKKQHIRGTWTKRESYLALRKMIMKEAPELKDKFPSYTKLRRIAEKDALRKLGGDTYENRWHTYLDRKSNDGWRRGAARGKELAETKENFLASFVDGRLDEGMKMVRAGKIASSIPYREMGYWPRVFTPEFNQVMEGILRSTRYKDQSALSYFMSHSRHRKFSEVDAASWNRLWAEGKMPHDFMEEIQKQVRAAKPSSSLGKRWNKMLSFLDAPQIAMYMDDIMETAYIRAKSSLRAVGNADYQAQLIKNVSRVLGPDEHWGMLGEKTYLLSPQSMEVFYGPGWRKKMGAEASEVYDAILKRSRLEKNADNLHAPFVENLSPADLEILKQKGVPVHAINGEVAEEMGKWMQKRTDPKSLGFFSRNYNEFMNWWKATTLAIWPGYFMRNFGANFWQAHGADSLSVKDYITSTGMIMTSDIWTYALPKKSIRTIPGIGTKVEQLRKGAGRKPLHAYDMKVSHPTLGEVAYTADFQINYMTRGGGFQTFAKNEIFAGAKEAGDPKSGLEALLRAPGVRWFSQYGGPVQVGWWLNSQMENIHRLTLFRNRLAKGYSPHDALMEVKKYFFPYELLTTFEKTHLRKWFPFYSWTRFNIPLQVSMMMTMPGKFGNFKRGVETFIQSEEGRDFDPKLLPKFVHESLGIPTRINKDTGNLEVLYGRYWWPGSDLMAVVHDNPIKSIGRTAGTMLAPFPKTVVEKIFNTSLYTEKPIAEYEGQETKFIGVPMTRDVEHVLRNVRGLSEFSKLFEGGPGGRERPLGTRMANLAGLPKIAAFKPELLQQRYNYEAAMLKGKLKKDYNRALKAGDMDLAERLLDRARKAAERKRNKAARDRGRTLGN